MRKSKIILSLLSAALGIWFLYCFSERLLWTFCQYEKNSGLLRGLVNLFSPAYYQKIFNVSGSDFIIGIIYTLLDISLSLLFLVSAYAIAGSRRWARYIILSASVAALISNGWLVYKALPLKYEDIFNLGGLVMATIFISCGLFIYIFSFASPISPKSHL